MGKDNCLKSKEKGPKSCFGISFAVFHSQIGHKTCSGMKMEQLKGEHVKNETPSNNEQRGRRFLL